MDDRFSECVRAKHTVTVLWLRFLEGLFKGLIHGRAYCGKEIYCWEHGNEKQ